MPVVSEINNCDYYSLRQETWGKSYALNLQNDCRFDNKNVLRKQAGVTAPIVGATSVPHFDDAVKAVDFNLTDEDN